MPTDVQPQILDFIPDPETVRERLGAALREVSLLRRLLRIARDKAKAEAGERQQKAVQA
jgi:hypothetical protein